MVSPTSIAGKCARGVLGPDQAVRKGWVESRRAASDRKMGANARAHLDRLARESANTKEASRGAKAESTARFDKPQGKAGASKAASTEPSGLEPRPLSVPDVTLEDSQSPRSSRVGTRRCRSAFSVGDSLFSLASSLLALSTVVGGAQASSDCGRFDSSKIKFATFYPQAMNPDNYVGNMGIDLRSALDLFQNISTGYWDRYGPNRALLPTVSLADCAGLPEGLPDPNGWDPSSWVSLGSGHRYHQRAMDYSQSIAYVMCELITNATSAILNVNGTTVDDRFYGCGLEFNASLPVNGTSSSGLPVNGTSSSGSVDVPVDYTPVIMFGVAFVVGLIQNAVLSYKATQDVVDVIDNTGHKNETQNFLIEAGKNVKAFGESSDPQVFSFVFGNALGVSVALLALRSAPIDWDKPWENEAVKNMVVFVGAQLIAELVSFFTDVCGWGGYSGGTMVGKPNKRLLKEKHSEFNQRISAVLNHDQFYKDKKTIKKVEALYSNRPLCNPIKKPKTTEHFSRVAKAMGPGLLSLAGLAVGLQHTKNNWLEKAGGGVALYVFLSAVVNAIVFLNATVLKRAGSFGSVQSRMACQALETMTNQLSTDDLDPRGSARPSLEMGQL